MKAVDRFQKESNKTPAKVDAVSPNGEIDVDLRKIALFGD